MKNTILLFTSIFIILNILGCSNSKQNTKINSLPTWYLNTPSNTYNKLYGTGEAFNINEAKTNALSNMSQKLIVSVNSNINTTTKTNGNSYSKDITKNINLKSKQISFNNYKVEKLIQSNSSFFVLLSVDKIALFNEKKKELNLLDNSIHTKINNIQNRSKLEKIYILEQLKPTITKAKDTAFLLYALDNNFNYSQYYSQYDEYINQIDIIKSNLSIKVVSNTKNTLYKEYLKELLTKESYKVSSNNEDVLIKISNNIRHSKARGWQIVKASSTLNIISNNKTISSKTISSIGRSSSNKQNALQSSAISFKKKLEKIGINKILYQ